MQTKSEKIEDIEYLIADYSLKVIDIHKRGIHPFSEQISMEKEFAKDIETLLAQSRLEGKREALEVSNKALNEARKVATKDIQRTSNENAIWLGAINKVIMEYKVRVKHKLSKLMTEKK